MNPGHDVSFIAILAAAGLAVFFMVLISKTLGIFIEEDFADFDHPSYVGDVYRPIYVYDSGNYIVIYEHPWFYVFESPPDVDCAAELYCCRRASFQEAWRYIKEAQERDAFTDLF